MKHREEKRILEDEKSILELWGNPKWLIRVVGVLTKKILETEKNTWKHSGQTFNKYNENYEPVVPRSTINPKHRNMKKTKPLMTYQNPIAKNLWIKRKS